ncbi:MAG: alanine--tRNA ligase [Erysipelothrix sp.]|nr:alanine--tRNA ligase [Erysipelothrix sp.]
MKHRTSQEIRQMFLDFFEKKDHLVEKGHSLIPHGDPTLLWINSGVAALKKYFDGSIKPSSNRLVNVQKSIRTNDIENVGKTARHHTFFEMLGNFSIGDYFKKDAISYAWEFLVSKDWIGFDEDKIYVSIHTDDTEAYDIWTKHIGLDPKRILKSDDNYWQIGEGPSGPQSEIFYDRGPKYDPENLGERLFFEEIENDRYLEVWNIVFSQYYAKDGVDRKDFEELPQKNIDTGMGFERLVSLVQDGETNFETDLFIPIIKATEKFTTIPYEENKEAYRVIADHIRTITFALGDGATFSNEGRGYVLRRLIRRAIRYGIQLNIQGSFMYRLVQVVIDVMDSFYPEVKNQQELIEKLIKIEEERFHLTLSDGEKMLNELLSKQQTITGEQAFKLYDTYGFPLEMTTEIALENNISVDTKGFKEHMLKQKEMSRAARVDSESMGQQHEDLLNFENPSVFFGYDHDISESIVIGLFVDGKAVDSLEENGQVIFDRTVFYAESGGQVADTGTISNSKLRGEITNVQKAPLGQHLHSVKVTSGSLSIGDKVILAIDNERRQFIRRNHSSVHLLHQALREIIGTHVQQAGSYVSDEYSRFDFSHYEKIDHKTLNDIESRVNDLIAQDSPVITEIMDIEEAKNSGAIALFDEKYDSQVRVVTMGPSKELCGGTHVGHSSQIGVYKLVSEESIGSGVRRIVAKSSLNAYDTFKDSETHLERIAKELNATSVTKIDEKLVQVLNENSSLQNQINKLEDSLVNHQMTSLLKDLEGNKLVFKSHFDSKLGKPLVEKLINALDDGVVFGAFVNDDKVSFVCAVSESWIKDGIKAGDLVKEAAKLTNGGGGGRPQFAQAGGKDISKVDEVISVINQKLLIKSS